MPFFKFVRTHLWATGATIVALALLPFNSFLQWRDLVALGVPAWGWTMISIIILAVCFVTLLYQQHKRIEELTASMNLEGALQPLDHKLDTISRRLSSVETDMALVRQEALKFAEGVPPFQAEMRTAMADHMAEVSAGWTDMEKRIRGAAEGYVSIFHEKIKNQCDQFQKSVDSQTIGLHFELQCISQTVEEGQRTTAAMIENARKEFTDMEARLHEQTEEIIRLSAEK